jgi:molecular chaperone DnaK
MISESLDHAFEDMSERAWTEAKLKAEEMLGAVETALARVGDSMGKSEKETIFNAAELVREALRTGDSRRLQGANASLDETTQELAALVIQKAMEAAP